MSKDNIYAGPHTIDDDETGFPDGLSNLVGSYGDPALWARSTLEGADPDDLVAIYAVVPGLLISKEAIRNRIWLHDILDDAGIPYYIEVGGLGGSKDLNEAQHIYVEKENAQKVMLLIHAFNNTKNTVKRTKEETGITAVSEDGIPQKVCSSCGEEIDFDYHKCPYCKTRSV